MEGLTTTDDVRKPSCTTGVKSRRGSYGSFERVTGLSEITSESVPHNV